MRAMSDEYGVSGGYSIEATTSGGDDGGVGSIESGPEEGSGSRVLSWLASESLLLYCIGMRMLRDIREGGKMSLKTCLKCSI
jgi:hypothetical protein